MDKQAISNAKFQDRYGWTPPKIVDRSNAPTKDIPTLPGLEDLHQHLPAKGITSAHPMYNDRNNPHVWGSLAGHHNPFLDHSLSSEDDVPDGWENNHGSGWNEGNNKLFDRVTKHLQKNVSAGHPCMRISDPYLHQALHEGRLKSQFETGTSKGSLNTEARATAEKANFRYQHPEARDDYGEHDYDEDEYDENERRGHEDKHPDHARPLYGYLAHDPVTNDTARDYGEHTLVFKKPKVWHRTTATFGDSLGEQSHKRASAVQKVSLASADPHDVENTWSGRAKEKPGYDEEENDLHNALSHHLNHSLDDFGGDYTEAQYHGGLTTNDIHYAILKGRGKNLDNHAAIKKHLDEVGVPWVHVSDDSHWKGHTKPTDQSREAMLHRAVDYQVTLESALKGSSMAPKVIAERKGGVYLIDLGNGKGQVAETWSGMLFRPRNVEAILARGYWQACDNVDAADVLALVKPV